MNIVPGVLGLQGSFEHHAKSLKKLGFSPRLVIKPEHVEGLTHLIIPGGESTTMHKLLQDYGLIQPIVDAYESGSLHLFGTCAGAILLGRAGSNDPPPRFGFADVQVDRNAYGRQLDSFTETISLGELEQNFKCVFIRAPKMHHPSPLLKVLGTRGDEPILIEGDRVLLATFHPELTNDLSIHRHFLGLGLPLVTTGERAKIPNRG